MCGIAGIVKLNGPITTEDVVAVQQHMLDTQVHRGPDGEGLVVLGQVSQELGEKSREQGAGSQELGVRSEKLGVRSPKFSSHLSLLTSCSSLSSPPGSQLP